MEKKKYFLLFCFFSAFLHILSGQGLQLAFHHLDQEDGLPPASQYYFSKGSRGFLWIGTDGGLCRYDGQSLLRFTHDPANAASISEDLVTSPCFEDADGNLWFTTFGAVQCMSRLTGVFRAWSLPASGQKDYHAFQLDKGRLWVRIGSSGEAGLYCFDLSKKNFQRVSDIEGNRGVILNDEKGEPANIIETALPDRAGFIWRSLTTGNGEHFEFLKTRNGRKRNYSSPTNGVLTEDDSLIWVGVYNGLGVFKPQDRQHWIEVDRRPEIPNDLGWVYDLVALDEQKLLVSCYYGLAVFDKKARAFTEFIGPQAKDPFSLKKAVYEGLFADSQGNIWVERDGQGITFANLRKHKFANMPDLTGESVKSLFEDREGNIWCSTESNGTYVFGREGKVKMHLLQLDNRAMPSEDTPLPGLKAIFEDKTGHLWGASSNYLFLWDENRGVFKFQDTYFLGVPNTPDDELNHFLKRPNGDILVAKGKDVFKLFTSLEKVRLDPWYDLSRFNLQTITALFQDTQGRIYIADKMERLLIFVETQGTLQLVAEMENTGVCNSFLQLGDSLVFAATSEGLLRIETEGWRYRPLDELTEGLPNEMIYQILSDKKGQLWLSGPNGLVRYDPGKKRFHRFNKSDGLASKGANAHTFFESSNGAYWLGGKNGLNVFRPEQVQLLTGAPPVYITDIFVNDTLFTQKNKGETTSLDLDYRRNTLSFRFAALDFSDPGSNKFFYRLKGYENNWVDNGNKGFVRYPNLPPGSYAFELKATNSDGVLGKEVKRLLLHIRPPFWRTWWFYLLCTLLFAGLVWAWSQYRLRQALKMERLRVKISSDLHDEVGTLLSGLAMQTEVMELSARQEDKPRLQRIAQLSRNAMQNMRDTVWAIDARKDKVENLLDRMREHAEEILTPREFYFKLHLKHLDLKKNLPVDIRQNLFLIYKEAITNIAKHSNGNAVTVSLTRLGEMLEMRICDNGRVADKNYKTTGLGLSNMQLRSARLGGALKIDTSAGFCVIVEIKMP